MENDGRVEAKQKEFTLIRLLHLKDLFIDNINFMDRCPLEDLLEKCYHYVESIYVKRDSPSAFD